MSDAFRAHAELEMHLEALFALQHGDGDAAAVEWESSKSYEARFADLLSIFVPQDGRTATSSSY